MDDLTSQIVQINTAGGLRIDSTPLEAILLSIAQALQNHDVLVSKLPEIETLHSDLRRDLNKLKIAVESTTKHCSDNVNTTCDSTDCNPLSNSLAIEEGTQNYGLRKCDSESLHQKRAEQTHKAHDEAATNGLRDVKVKLLQLQQHRDEALANSLETDAHVKAMKDDLLRIEQKLTASVNMAQLHRLQQSMAANHRKMEEHLNEFQGTFREEVQKSIDDYLANVKSSFASLESFLKQRQDKIDTRVASCAKEYDTKRGFDDIQSDISSLTRQTLFLGDTAKAQGKVLVQIQQKNAIIMFHRRYSEWKRNALKFGITRWKQAVQRDVKYQRDKASQKRLMKKILTNVMSRRKRIGFEKWIRHRDWHRKTELLKVKASALVYERLKSYLTGSKANAFHTWRRMTVLDNMKCVVDSEIQQSTELSSENVIIQSRTDRREIHYDLNDIIESLKNDAYGVSCALSREMQNMKVQDIASLQRSVTATRAHLMTTTAAMVDEAVHKIDLAAQEFQTYIEERVGDCDAQFPSINTQLKELSNLLKSHKAHVENIEESNDKRLGTLFDQNDGIEKRLCLVEELARNTAIQVASMADEQTKANDSIIQISQMIRSNEARRDEESNALREVMDRFGDELLRTKVTLGHTQVRCEHLEEELTDAKNELAYFQEVSQFENAKVAEVMDHPGIQQTNLDRIVRVGHAYENLAKEKNYVTGINVTATMISDAGPSMKSNEEKRKREGQVHVPAEIAAFAHDYAEWIAYQADHESLLRLIAGTNPDEQVYAEDDTIARRKGLLDDLRSNLSTELERASVPGVVDSPDATTRGLGLRWEARAIFLARVVEATKSALSKHDHISMPAQTRLGRTRPESANITVCVACDRPCLRKVTQSQQSSKHDGDTRKKNIG
eukprot:scaffold356446_cov70-Cyclotella_meneghiniana.AAC.1